MRAAALLFLALALLGLAPGMMAAGDPAPGFTAPRVDGGGDLALDDFQGEVVLLNIWATWCEPCKREMPELQALSDEYAGQGLHVIGVSVDIGVSNERIQTFADDLGVRFPLVRDEDGAISKAYRTSGVPETILIDRAGTIAYQWKGELEAGGEGQRTAIEAALASEGVVAEEALPRVAGIGFVAAFSAGLLSMLSPCVFPLLPTYAAYMTGASIDELTAGGAQARRKRWSGLRNGLLFVTGFSLVFIAMGASASAIGGVLYDFRDWIARIGGVLLLVMGLHLLGLLRIPALDRIVRPNVRITRSARPLTTFLVGMAFGAGWTPCIGPALASILTLAATTGSMLQGMALLAVYSLGLAIPFLLGTLLIDRVVRHRRDIGPWLPRLERFSGALVVGIGLLMLTGAFSRLATLTSGIGPLA